MDSPVGGSPRNSSLVKLSDLNSNSQQSLPTETDETVIAVSDETDSKECNSVDGCVSPTCDSSTIETSTSSNEFILGVGDDSNTSCSDSDDDEVLAFNFTNNCSLQQQENNQQKHPLSLSVSSTYAAAAADADNDDAASTCSGSTSGPDSERSSSPSYISDLSSMCDIVSLTATAEAIAEARNLLFPSSAGSPNSNGTTSPKPTVFSVNLGKLHLKSDVIFLSLLIILAVMCLMFCNSSYIY